MNSVLTYPSSLSTDTIVQSPSSPITVPSSPVLSIVMMLPSVEASALKYRPSVATMNLPVISVSDFVSFCVSFDAVSTSSSSK